MLKDIYIIRNTVNDKCYVGQSVDYKTRFRKHKEEAKRAKYKYRSVLYDAMNELGFDKFYVEVLESGVENYDEREIFWIKELNTLDPNGYNLAPGGIEPLHLTGVNHHGARIKNNEDLMGIYGELLNTDYSLTEIGEHFGCGYDVVFGINQGLTYRIDGYSFPLREFTISKGKLDRLTYDLKYSNYSYDELASIYGISKQQVKTINYGRSWYRDYVSYPIRKIQFSGKGDSEALYGIQRDLLSTRLSFKDIGEKYGCSENTVRRINSGETNRSTNYLYPLRKEEPRLSQDVLNGIYDKLLNTTESINDIAKFAGVSDSTIKRINKGETRKYYDNKYTYPVRAM